MKLPCCLAFAFFTCVLSSSLNVKVPTTWSNRQGLTLTPITTGLWAAERPFTWNKIDVGGRSVIARMNDGNLLVYSPVEFTESLGNCIASLGGEVKYIVIPNYEHLSYSLQWSQQYPDATCFSCPGLSTYDEKFADWTVQLEEDASIIIDDSVERAVFDCEINPFTGKPFFNEVSLYHKKSKTFFMADTFWNYPGSSSPNLFPDFAGREDSGMESIYQHTCPKMPSPLLVDSKIPEVKTPFGTRLWKFGMDQVYLPFYKNAMVGRKGERRVKYERVVEKVLSWDIEVIAPCHGDVIRGKETCRKVLEKHFLG
jgi:hypothetical protein